MSHKATRALHDGGGMPMNTTTNDSTDTAATLALSILSKEMQEELLGMTTRNHGGTDETPLVVLPSSNNKKKKKKKSHTELTSAELQQAKLVQKQTQRKLQQLSDRRCQTQKRRALYRKLQQSEISGHERELLQSSATLGQTETKRQTVRRLWQREQAGLVLTPHEQELLYPNNNHGTNINADGTPLEEEEHVSHKEAGVLDDVTEPKRKKAKKRRNQNRDCMDEARRAPTRLDEEREESACDKEPKSNVLPLEVGSSLSHPDVSGVAVLDTLVENIQEDRSVALAENLATASSSLVESGPIDFAAQMMASLTSLRTKSNVQKEESERLELERKEQAEKTRLEAEAKELRERIRYVPTQPAVLKTAARIGLQQKDPSASRVRQVLKVMRPQAVQEKRYELPVSGMEFEIVDAVRNSDVVILCSETGSGKSTQVPQFLYEAGLTTTDDGRDDLIIGITQPRRVAAVSTAKRVCYEMGHGDGQSIPPAKSGNLVAYQTRYESSGFGKDTRVKFMTDGILLQEIQSDLLLRKYGAIVLDEAHERNLNTDVLLGLLSAAVPLRRKASMEEKSGITPLKLIIMSATLRVEDFMANEKLFPVRKPILVTVPGRTHPVTIHHSKVTELDDYETVAFNKICKIHRKLPNGGILVFLNGKQEISRMVRKLQRALGYTKAGATAVGKDQSLDEQNDVSGAPRDLDDDEVDGDFFDSSEHHDDFDNTESDVSEDDVSQPERIEEGGIPRSVLILPLYSMLSADEQAKVFAPVPDGHRLIVVATNIAETSITIPGISYVVDTGRQKCRNHHAGTGVASYDIMWISKAAADQRAGRAGRTGPGHCYRLYSSSMYSRHMNDFALPEVLTRPLEDVVLAMKAMNISNVCNFPFPTTPDRSQVDAAVKLLANIGCLDISNVDKAGGDGEITRLGAAVAKLPLGVRYGKMLLVAAQAGVLDYAIVLVAVLSESSPFAIHVPTTKPCGEDGSGGEEDDSLDEVDRSLVEKQEHVELREKRRKWMHKGGDILAGLLAVGAYTYAGRGAGGAAEKLACRRFCEANGLTVVVMERIQRMRRHLARLAKTRFSNAEGVAAKTGGILNSMPPPNKLQERLLMQAIVSGLLDNVAILAPPGAITGDHPSVTLRSAYLGCSSSLNTPLLMDRYSVLYSRDSRQLPGWVCFDSIVRKSTKDGRTLTTMKNVTPLDPAWLGTLARHSRMVSLTKPLPSPLPMYDTEKDVVLCSVMTKYGSRGWEIPPAQVEMFDALQTTGSSACFLKDDSFRWFARFLWEGKVIREFQSLVPFWNDEPTLITRKTPVAKVALLVAALSSAGVDSAAALRKHWAEVNHKFLFQEAQRWTKPDNASEMRRIWIDAVKTNVKLWKKGAEKRV